MARVSGNSLRAGLPILLLLCGPATRAETLTSPTLNATIRDGGIVSLEDAQHHAMAKPAAGVNTKPVLFVGSAPRYDQLPVAYSVDQTNGDLVVSPQGIQPDVAGVEQGGWRLGPLPLGMNIILPAGGGRKLTSENTQKNFEFAGPMSLEAPFFIAEGNGYGLYAFAEEAAWPFFKISIEKSAQGWVATFLTQNNKPWKDKHGLPNLTWRVNTYRGDWRVAARRYRDHFAATCVDTAQDSPVLAWTRQITCVVIDGPMEIKRLEELVEQKRLDPKQTLLFVSQWRFCEFDRNYPVYDRFHPRALAFIRRAKELGFRVMLYTNWWGIAKDSPLYERFRPFLVRNDAGDLVAYINKRRKPPVEFNYVHPGCKAWRDYFVAQMTQLVKTTGVDAIHLDQDFHVYNYGPTIVDGMSMIEGTLAFHQALRQALPGIALGSEGLNGLTARYVSLAQRHVWSLLEKPYAPRELPRLREYHPVSTYIFHPHTEIYGWMGTADPDRGQDYAAWREALNRMGAMPTMHTLFLKTEDTIRNPQGWRRQQFDEIAFWQAQRLSLDLDGAWPATVMMPYKTAGGESAVRGFDGAFRCGDREISRTLFGVMAVDLPGTIPGWYCYDTRQLFGLNPALWYPYFDTPRNLQAFHVEALDDAFEIARVACRTNALRIDVVARNASTNERESRIAFVLPALWPYAVVHQRIRVLAPRDGRYALDCRLPATVYILRDEPDPRRLPLPPAPLATAAAVKDLHWQWGSRSPKASGDVEQDAAARTQGTGRFRTRFEKPQGNIAFANLGFAQPVDLSLYDGLAFDIESAGAPVADGPGDTNTLWKLMLMEKSGAVWYSQKGQRLPARQGELRFLYSDLVPAPWSPRDPNGHLDRDAIVRMTFGCTTDAQAVDFSLRAITAVFE